MPKLTKDLTSVTPLFYVPGVYCRDLGYVVEELVDKVNTLIEILILLEERIEKLEKLYKNEE